MVRLGCSKQPIPLDNQGLITLNAALTSVREKLLHHACSSLLAYNSTIDIPSIDTWTLVMCHLGRDSLQRFEGKSFNITINDLNGELLHVYSKHLTKHKRVIRLERQVYPNISMADVIRKKLWS